MKERSVSPRQAQHCSGTASLPGLPRADEARSPRIKKRKKNDVIRDVKPDGFRTIPLGDLSKQSVGHGRVENRTSRKALCHDPNRSTVGWAAYHSPIFSMDFQGS